MLRTISFVATASLAVLASCCVSTAEARIYLDATRIIFAGEKREASIRVTNEADNPSLVQTWISEEASGSAPEAATVPFVIRPPLFRIDGGRSQVIRILHAGTQLPQDRESLFWLNVREVPAGARGDSGSPQLLHLVLNKKMKLLYRPKTLRAAGASQAPAQLQWSVVREGQGWELQATNGSPFFVNVNSIDTAGGKVDVGTGAVPPMGSARYRLSHAQRQSLGQSITFEYINDQGGVRSIDLPLSPL